MEEELKKEPKYLEKTCYSVTLYTAQTDLGWITGHRSEKPATNRLSYDAVTHLFIRKKSAQKGRQEQEVQNKRATFSVTD
jgi:hypothetical protein